LIGTLVVIALYVALNAVFLASTPLGELAGQVDVAIIAGRHIFGEFGGRLVGALICLGLISSISAMTWIGPRVTMAMGEDFSLLRIFSRKSKHNVPAVAIVFQALVANLLLLTQSFEAVLQYVQFSLTFCSFFTVLGVIKMRFTHPDLPRPYRAWFYPITPVIFLAVTFYMMYHLIVGQPRESLAGFATMVAGLVIYFASRAFSKVPKISEVSSPENSQTVA
jgi:basic amino acid/polyamine antiporter, APA family